MFFPLLDQQKSAKHLHLFPFSTAKLFDFSDRLNNYIHINISLQHFICILKKKKKWSMFFSKWPGNTSKTTWFVNTATRTFTHTKQITKGSWGQGKKERKNLLQASLELREILILPRAFPAECSFTSKLFLHLQHPTSGSYQESQGIGSTLPFYSGKQDTKVAIFHWHSPLIFTD